LFFLGITRTPIINVTFSIPKPGAIHNSSKISIKYLTIADNLTPYIKWVKEDASRIIKFVKEGEDSFLVVKFPYNAWNPNISLKATLDIINEGIIVNGEKFNFFGYSANQIKKRTCYFFRGDVDVIDKLLSRIGNFRQINSVSKQAARIGLLFSSCIFMVTLDNNYKLPDITDIIRNGYNFTDGCGLLSHQLAKHLSKTANIQFRNSEFTPSVFQIRWAGYKGIVVVDKRKDINKKWIQFRTSMKKFDLLANDFNLFGICDYSKPYSFGHLNRQFIMLLSGLGVLDKVFEEKQDEYYKDLANFQDTEVAIKYLIKHNQLDFAESLLTEKPLREDIKGKLAYIFKKEIEALPKLKIMIPKSRNVFGVCDETHLLRYGQVQYCLVEHVKLN
jgi:hypothetical protein